MLPPGIYFQSHFENGKSTSLLSENSPFTLNEIKRLSPFETVFLLEGHGEFVQSSISMDRRIVVVEQCETTMQVVRNLLELNLLSTWDAVISVNQSHGRGQLRRPWVSSNGNLHMSIVLPKIPKSGVWSNSLPYLLPLVFGHVYCSILEDYVSQLKIKWPNDILQHDRKVGGMLIEEKGETTILGLGLNLTVAPSDSQMRKDHSVPAGVLEGFDRDQTPISIGECLVIRGERVYRILLDELEPREFLSILEKRLAWMGLNILVDSGTEGSYQARIIGISPQGGLVVSRGQEESIIYSGSILPL